MTTPVGLSHHGHALQFQGHLLPLSKVRKVTPLGRSGAGYASACNFTHSAGALGMLARCPEAATWLRWAPRQCAEAQGVLPLLLRSLFLSSEGCEHCIWKGTVAAVSLGDPYPGLR